LIGAVPLRLERAVVDGLRLLDLAEAPRADALGRGDGDADVVEALGALRLAQDVHKVGHGPLLQLGRDIAT